MLVVEEVCLLLRRMRDSAVTMIRPGLYRRPFHAHDWIEKVGLNTSFAMKGPRVSLRVSELLRIRFEFHANKFFSSSNWLQTVWTPHFVFVRLPVEST
jgi:hypothetical protein